MGKKKVLYKTIYTVEVISQEPQILDLEEIHNEITFGESSGVCNVTNGPLKIKGKKAVKEVKAQGSDTEFFGMDEEGNKIEDDYINDMLDERFDNGF